MVGTSKFVFASGGKTANIVVESGEPLDRQSAELLAERIGRISGDAPQVPDSPGRTASDTVHLGVLGQSPAIRSILNQERILITDTDQADFNADEKIWKPSLRDLKDEPLSLDLLKASRTSAHLLFADDLGSEGYVIYLSADRKALVITGNTPFAVMYGAYKVADCIYRDGQDVLADGFGTTLIPLLSRPMFRRRSVCGQTSGWDGILAGQWEKEWATHDGYDYRGFIDFLAEHGINTYVNWNFMDQLVLGLSYRSERFAEAVNPFHPNVKHEFYGEMLDYAHSRNIKVIITINFPDRWHGIVRSHPEIAAEGFSPDQLPNKAEWRRWQQENVNPAFNGTVCASKPETRKIFREYITDILEHFPQIDGVAAQFGEGYGVRCRCRRCMKDFYELQREYFNEMVKIVRRDRPDRMVLDYRSPGAVEMMKKLDEIPNHIWGDWDSRYTNYMVGKSVVRGSWHTYHRFNAMWNEYGMRQITRICAERGVMGFEKRAVSYKVQAHDYLAFREFTWSGRTSLEDLAHIQTIKSFGEVDAAAAVAYTHWMKAVGAYQRLAFFKDFPETGGGQESRNQTKNEYRRHLAAFRRELKKVRRDDLWTKCLKNMSENPDPELAERDKK